MRWSRQWASAARLVARSLRDSGGASPQRNARTAGGFSFWGTFRGVSRRRGSLFATALAFVLLGAFLGFSVGCRHPETPNKRSISFGYWGDYRDNEVWRTIVANFEKLHPDVDVVPNWVPGDYGNKLPLLMISGNAPDIILMDDEFLPAYAVRGYLEDLKPYIDRDAQEIRLDDFFARGLESFNYRGFQGGMPWAGNVMMIFYNQDLFDAAGLPYPTDEWTWMDFRRDAKDLTRDLDGDGRIDQYGCILELWLTAFEPFVWCWGGEILNQDNTRSALHGPRVLEAAQFIYNMKFIDKSTAVTAEMEGFSQEAQILTGRLGMAVGGSYIIQTLDAVHGGMRWGVAPIPYGPYGDRATRATFDGISIYSKITREKKGLAWEFIKFVLSADSQRYIGERRRGIPVHRADAVKYYVREDSGADEMLIVNALDYAKLTPVTPFFLELRNDTQRVFDAMNLGKLTPAEAVPRFDGIIDEVLSKEIERWGTEES